MRIDEILGLLLIEPDGIELRGTPPLERLEALSETARLSTRAQRAIKNSRCPSIHPYIPPFNISPLRSLS